MKGTFDYTSEKSGRSFVLEVEYECVMKSQTHWLDGDVIEGKPKPMERGKLRLLEGGKKLRETSITDTWSKAHWDERNGAWTVQGLGFGFTDEETANRYNAWLDGIIEQGTTDEVKAYRAAEEARQAANRVEHAKKVIEKAEKQADIPSDAEARRREKEWNDIYNEGGDGYVPHIISMDEYEEAKRVIESNGR